ncbi:MAG TPA: hypothetical protein VGK89_14515 [Candidatus Eisenbacteria bacterium]|jgi:hypothetical protein
MKNQEPALHFILRFSDNLRGVDTFAEHKRLEEKFGNVWWGKFGVGVATRILDRARAQVKAMVPTYVYLAANRSIRFRGEVVDVLGGGGNGRYKPKDVSRIPQYYRGEGLAVWFKLKGLRRATAHDKDGLVLFNDKSSQPALNGMKGLIYVCRGTPRAPTRHGGPGGASGIDEHDWDKMADFLED